MYHTELRAKPLDVVLDVGFQTFEIQTIFVQTVKHLLFCGETVSLRSDFGSLHICRKCADELGEEVASNVRNSVKGRRLEILEASMVEDLAN